MELGISAIYSQSCATEVLVLREHRLGPGEPLSLNTGGFAVLRVLSGELLLSGSDERLRPGDLFFSTGDGTAAHLLSSGCEASVLCFTFLSEHLHALLDTEEIAALEVAIQALQPVSVFRAESSQANCVSKIMEDAAACSGLQHRAQLLAAAGVLVALPEADPRNGNGTAPFLEKVRKLSVDEVVSLSADQLAERLMMSRRTMARAFDGAFKVSLATIRMQMRLSRAAALLEGSDLKIVEIAEQSGFNHLGLFNTCFRKRYGTSPRQFRSERRARAEPPHRPNAQCALSVAGLCPSTSKT